MKKDTMTVNELIKSLKKMNPDAPVYCSGELPCVVKVSKQSGICRIDLEPEKHY